MKKFLIALLVIGILLAIAGGIIFGVSYSKAKMDTNIETKTYDIEEVFTNFEFDVDISDVEFKVSEDGKTKVEVKETEDYAHIVKVEDGTLKVKQQDDRKWYNRVFVFNLGSMKVTVYMPAGAYGDLNVDASTGYIRIPHDFSFNSINLDLSTGDMYISSNVVNTLKIKASTGDANLSDMTAKNIDLHASTGKANFSNVQVEETIKVDLSTGKTIFENVTAKNYVHESSTGKVNLKNVIIAEEMDLETSTGAITFEDCDAARITIKTDTGDVRGTLLTAKIFSVRTDTGKFDVPTSTEGGLCKIDTDTGNVSIQIK